MNLDALQLKLASDYVFAVSEAALHFVYHEVCNTVAGAGKARQARLRLTRIACQLSSRMSRAAGRR